MSPTPHSINQQTHEHTTGSAAPFIPPDVSIAKLKPGVDQCRGCDLYKHATQGVAGSGDQEAPIMIVGEQPGDQEDLEGKPFVGPAGSLLLRALNDAGVPTSAVYITNAVKHFKFIERGKRRLHQKPNTFEIQACYPWLLKELEIIKPKLIVCLGSTAARSVLGRTVRIASERGKLLPHNGASCLITNHPSALLRIPKKSERELAYKRFVEELELATHVLS